VEKWPVGRPGGKEMGLAQSNRSIFYLFKKFQTDFNLIQSKDGLPILENFQIKYGIVGN
jgi:hypothetical protein